MIELINTSNIKEDLILDIRICGDKGKKKKVATPVIVEVKRAEVELVARVKDLGKFSDKEIIKIMGGCKKIILDSMTDTILKSIEVNT